MQNERSVGEGRLYIMMRPSSYSLSSSCGVSSVSWLRRRRRRHSKYRNDTSDMLPRVAVVAAIVATSM
jgi:hypothetical protein